MNYKVRLACGRRSPKGRLGRFHEKLLGLVHLLSRAVRDAIMALIKCAECGRQVSSLASACPACGAPPSPRSEWSRMLGEDQPLLSQAQATQAPQGRKMGWALGLGVVFLPIVFSWFTLRQGHSSLARVIAFGWLAVVMVPIVLSSSQGPQPPLSGAKPPSPPSPSSTATNSSDPIARCSQFLGVSAAAGVDIQKAYGAPTSIMGQAEWCRAHRDQFQGK